jgi:hypothetical protein
VCQHHSHLCFLLAKLLGQWFSRKIIFHNAINFSVLAEPYQEDRGEENKNIFASLQPAPGLLSSR